MKPKQFLIKYGTRFVIAVAVLAVIVGAGASSRNGKAGLFKNADGSLKAPVQKAASAVVDWIESLYGYIYTYDSLVAENETLRAENAQIREQVRNYEEVDAENVRLRELLNLKQKHSDFVFVSAKIVSWDPSDYTSIFSVSKGSEDGIEVGDCVLTEYGTLVGQVFELGDTWCNIRTIIDVDMDLGALAG
ncbi:MAG: rod shape-determining protein MreC, partial [Oscillospiraceae bacterium]|nr:rod shape-determining protein MreC [Oscillospiraceae bacterium]